MTCSTSHHRHPSQSDIAARKSDWHTSPIANMVSSTLFTTITSLALLSLGKLSLNYRTWYWQSTLAHAEGDIVPNIVVSKCPIDIACAQPVIPDITTIYENPPVIVWNNITSTSTKVSQQHNFFRNNFSLLTTTKKIIPVTKWNYTVVVEPVNVGQEGEFPLPLNLSHH